MLIAAIITIFVLFKCNCTIISLRARRQDCHIILACKSEQKTKVKQGYDADVHVADMFHDDSELSLASATQFQHPPTLRSPVFPVRLRSRHPTFSANAAATVGQLMTIDTDRLVLHSTNKQLMLSLMKYFIPYSSSWCVRK